LTLHPDIEMNRYSIAILLAISVLAPAAAFAEQVGCVTTEWKLIGANHKVLRRIVQRPEGTGRHLSRQPGANRGRQRFARPGTRPVAVFSGLPADRPDHAAG
jgi:hypothetical protein